MSKYDVSIIGRTRGAIGVTHSINDIIEAEDDIDFANKLYDKYELISYIKVNGKILSHSEIQFKRTEKDRR